MRMNVGVVNLRKAREANKECLDSISVVFMALQQLRKKAIPKKPFFFLSTLLNVDKSCAS